MAPEVTDSPKGARLRGPGGALGFILRGPQREECNGKDRARRSRRRVRLPSRGDPRSPLQAVLPQDHRDPPGHRDPCEAYSARQALSEHEPESGRRRQSRVGPSRVDGGWSGDRVTLRRLVARVPLRAHLGRPSCRSREQHEENGRGRADATCGRADATSRSPLRQRPSPWSRHSRQLRVMSSWHM